MRILCKYICNIYIFPTLKSKLIIFYRENKARRDRLKETQSSSLPRHADREATNLNSLSYAHPLRRHHLVSLHASITFFFKVLRRTETNFGTGKLGCNDAVGNLNINYTDLRASPTLIYSTQTTLLPDESTNCPFRSTQFFCWIWVARINHNSTLTKNQRKKVYDIGEDNCLIQICLI